MISRTRRSQLVPRTVLAGAARAMIGRFQLTVPDFLATQVGWSSCRDVLAQSTSLWLAIFGPFRCDVRGDRA